MQSHTVKEEHVPPFYSYSAKDIKLHVYGGITYFGMVNDSDLSKETIKQINNSEFNVNKYYINNTSIDINVSIRNGLVTTVPSDTNIINPNFIIRDIITFKKTSLKAVIKHIASLNIIEDSELSKIKNKLSNLDSLNEVKILLDYVIPLDDIKAAAESTIYHYQTDTLLSTKKLLEIPSHPFYGDKGNFKYLGEVVKLNNVNYNTLVNGQTNKYDYGNIDSLHLRLRYVDHTPTASVKYINILNKVYCIFPEKSGAGQMVFKGKTIESINYVEIAHTAKNDYNISNNNGVSVKRYTLEEAKREFGLYDTYIEAATNGSIENRRKAELTKMEHDIQVAKAKLNADKTIAESEAAERMAKLNKDEISLQELRNEALRIKAINDLENAKIDSEQRKLKMDQSKLDQDLKNLENTRTILEMQRKELEAKLARDNASYKADLDRRASNRKDIIDGLKYIPGIIIAVGGIATLLAKKSTK